MNSALIKKLKQLSLSSIQIPTLLLVGCALEVPELKRPEPSTGSPASTDAPTAPPPSEVPPSVQNTTASPDSVMPDLLTNVPQVTSSEGELLAADLDFTDFVVEQLPTGSRLEQVQAIEMLSRDEIDQWKKSSQKRVPFDLRAQESALIRATDLFFTKDLPYSDPKRKSAIDQAEDFCSDAPEYCHFINISPACGDLVTRLLTHERTSAGRFTARLALSFRQKNRPSYARLPILVLNHSTEPTATSTECTIGLSYLNGTVITRKPVTLESSVEAVLVGLQPDFQQSVLNAAETLPDLTRRIETYDQNLRFCATRTKFNPVCARYPHRSGCPEVYRTCARYGKLWDETHLRWQSFEWSYGFERFKQ